MHAGRDSTRQQHGRWFEFEKQGRNIKLPAFYYDNLSESPAGPTWTSPASIGHTRFVGHQHASPPTAQSTELHGHRYLSIGLCAMAVLACLAVPRGRAEAATPQSERSHMTGPVLGVDLGARFFIWTTLFSSRLRGGWALPFGLSAELFLDLAYGEDSTLRDECADANIDGPYCRGYPTGDSLLGLRVGAGARYVFLPKVVSPWLRLALAGGFWGVSRHPQPWETLEIDVEFGVLVRGSPAVSIELGVCGNLIVLEGVFSSGVDFSLTLGLGVTWAVAAP